MSARLVSGERLGVFFCLGSEQQRVFACIPTLSLLRLRPVCLYQGAFFCCCGGSKTHKHGAGLMSIEERCSPRFRFKIPMSSSRTTFARGLMTLHSGAVKRCLPSSDELATRVVKTQVCQPLLRLEHTAGGRLLCSLLTTGCSSAPAPPTRESSLQVYRHKFAVIFRKAVNPKDAPGYEKVREARRHTMRAVPTYLVVRMVLILGGCCVYGAHRKIWVATLLTCANLRRIFMAVLLGVGPSSQGWHSR